MDRCIFLDRATNTVGYYCHACTFFRKARQEGEVYTGSALFEPERATCNLKTFSILMVCVIQGGCTCFGSWLHVLDVIFRLHGRCGKVYLYWSNKRLCHIHSDLLHCCVCYW